MPKFNILGITSIALAANTREYNSNSQIVSYLSFAQTHAFSLGNGKIWKFHGECHNYAKFYGGDCIRKWLFWNSLFSYMLWTARINHLKIVIYVLPNSYTENYPPMSFALFFIHPPPYENFCLTLNHFILLQFSDIVYQSI